MKVSTILTTAMILGTFTIGTTVFMTGTVSAQGPISSLSNFDTDGNGSITEQEFNTAREKMNAQMKASGRLGSGMANSPSFADTDTNNDGQVSAEEFKAMQDKQQAGRGQGRGMGKGQNKK